MTGVIFKVDVDTYRGLKRGVPALLDLFSEFDMKASFFVSLGPDHSGRAIFRIFTRKGFLKKMLRTRAPGMYGISTLFYGTLLPAPRMAESLPDRIRSIPERGHEVGIHCWDHVKWQDRLRRMSQDEIGNEFGRARRAFREVLNRDAESCAAPGWVTSRDSLAVQDRAGLLYCSDMRGDSPFFPVLEGEHFSTLQIPTTLPTLDEILGIQVKSDREISDYYLTRMKPDRLHIMTIHAETEGIGKRVSFRGILEGIRTRLPVRTLAEAARNLLKTPGTIPDCGVVYGSLPGRAGTLSLQGERI